MQLPDIECFWMGRPLGTIERLSLCSFLANGHHVRLHSYCEVGNLPAAVELADASKVVPFDPTITISKGFGAGSLAPFADYFRMSLLAQRGGVWTDLDVVCLKPWRDLPPRFIATSMELPAGPLPNINVMRLSQNDDVATGFLGLWKTKRDSDDFASGVRLLGDAIESSIIRPVLMPPLTFNPVSYRHARYLIQPQEPVWHPRRLKRIMGITERVGGIGNDTYGIHLWGEIWRQNGWDRDARYHSDSIFEQLKRRYPASAM